MIKEKALQRHKYRSLRTKEKYSNETAPWDAARNFLSLFPIMKKKKISIYWPTGGELDTKPLISVLNDKGAVILLPKIYKNSLLFKKWSIESKLCYDEKNTFSPFLNEETIIPEIVIVPLVAYDIKGNRLGQGGGYYDKYALNNPTKLFIGYCYSIQEMNIVPREEHDMILNYIVTEKKIIKLNRE